MVKLLSYSIKNGLSLPTGNLTLSNFLTIKLAIVNF